MKLIFLLEAVKESFKAIFACIELEILF